MTVPLLGLCAVTETLQKLVDEEHPEIEIADEWLFGCCYLDQNSGLDKIIPFGMHIMLDLTPCWPTTDTPRYFGALLKIRNATTQSIQRIYRIYGHVPLTNTWTAKWVD